MRYSTILVFGLASVVLASAAETPSRFFKGNTHAHSLWSDGNDFPEMVMDFYHRNGYDFAVLSDHNTFAEGYRWKSVREIKRLQKVAGPGAIEKCEARFGPDWIEWEEHEGERGVVLKTLREYRGQFEAPGEFLIIEAQEISDKSVAGSLHINALNLERLVTPAGNDTLSTVKVMRQVLRTVAEQEVEIGRPILAHLNHPNYKWVVTPEDLAAVVEERFFEVYNGHPGVNHLGSDEIPGDEMMWDIANTIRVGEMGEAPLFGVATDDSHYYHGGDISPGRGWVMVEADALTSNRLIIAMRAGDFYASSGVVLSSVSYDASTRMIAIDIEADDDAEFTSELIGTLKDQKSAVDDIGAVFNRSTSRQVRFRVPENALYARVTITSSADHANPSFDAQKKQAWTQPVGWR